MQGLTKSCVACEGVYRGLCAREGEAIRAEPSITCMLLRLYCSQPTRQAVVCDVQCRHYRLLRLMGEGEGVVCHVRPAYIIDCEVLYNLLLSICTPGWLVVLYSIGRGRSIPSTQLQANGISMKADLLYYRAAARDLTLETELYWMPSWVHLSEISGWSVAQRANIFSFPCPMYQYRTVMCSYVMLGGPFGVWT